jgi:hypothetical protein
MNMILVLLFVLTTIMMIAALGNSDVQIQAKKHSECYKAGQSDGDDHPFDASRWISKGL